MSDETVFVTDLITLIILAIAVVSVFSIYVISPNITSTPQFQQLQDMVIEAVLMLVSFITGKNTRRQN
jgi:hypothetical protein